MTKIEKKDAEEFVNLLQNLTIAVFMEQATKNGLIGDSPEKFVSLVKEIRKTLINVLTD